MIMSAVEEVANEAPAVKAVPKGAMTLGYGTSLVVLGLLIIAPIFLKNFFVFQMTMLLIYALAVLFPAGTLFSLLLSRTLAVVSMVSVAMPAFSAAKENAMVKQAACAAPTISSGLVPLRSSPKRLAKP